MKGRGFLKVCGILLIIGGALGIILGIISIGVSVSLGALAATGAVDLGKNYTAAVAITVLLFAGIIGIVSGIVELITGIIGVKNSAKPEHSTKCLVWGIITLVLSVISVILAIASGGSNAGLIITSVISGLALPILFIIGAALNKKAFKAGVTSQTLAAANAAPAPAAPVEAAAPVEQAAQAVEEAAQTVEEAAQTDDQPQA